MMRIELVDEAGVVRWSTEIDDDAEQEPVRAALTAAQAAGLDVCMLYVVCRDYSDRPVEPEHALLDEIRTSLHVLLEGSPGRAADLHRDLLAGAFTRLADYVEIPLGGAVPARTWFVTIGRGDTPANSHAAAIAALWVETWIRGQQLGERIAELGRSVAPKPGWSGDVLAEIDRDDGGES